MSSNTQEVALFSYWRSSSSWRVRIVLNLKGIKYDYKEVNLLKGEQKSEEFLTNNPNGKIPTLKYGSNYISESIAIIEFLEETFEGTKVLPKDSLKRAVVRELSQIIVSDCQPIQNLKVLQKISKDFGEEHKMSWGKYWIEEALKAFEKRIKSTCGKFCVGDEVTMADICLIPQVYNANRFGVDMKQFPKINSIVEQCESLQYFKDAHPDQQPDKPKQ